MQVDQRMLLESAVKRVSEVACHCPESAKRAAARLKLQMNEWLGDERFKATELVAENRKLLGLALSHVLRPEASRVPSGLISDLKNPPERFMVVEGVDGNPRKWVEDVYVAVGRFDHKVLCRYLLYKHGVEKMDGDGIDIARMTPAEAYSRYRFDYDNAAAKPQLEFEAEFAAPAEVAVIQFLAFRLCGLISVPSPALVSDECIWDATVFLLTLYGQGWKFDWVDFSAASELDDVERIVEEQIGGDFKLRLAQVAERLILHLGRPAVRAGGSKSALLKRGRRPVDEAGDRRLLDAWNSGCHKTKAELARELQLIPKDVERAIDRARKRAAPSSPPLEQS